MIERRCRKCVKILSLAEYAVTTFVGLCNRCAKEEMKVLEGRRKKKI